MHSINNNILAVFAILLILFSLFGNIIVFKKADEFEKGSNGLKQITGKLSYFGQINLSIIRKEYLISIGLLPGQNWFSIPVNMSNNSVTAVLASLGAGAGSGHDVFVAPGCTGNALDNFVGNYTAVWGYNTSSGTWLLYKPDRVCFQIFNESLKEILPFENYQIMMNTSDSIEGSGYAIQTVSIPLYIGMEWIGFPRLNERAINVSFNSLGSGAGSGHDIFVAPGCTGNASDNFVGNYTSVWGYNASSGTWLLYKPDRVCFQIFNESLKKLIPGNGYQIMMTVNETWEVDW